MHIVLYCYASFCLNYQLLSDLNLAMLSWVISLARRQSYVGHSDSGVTLKNIGKIDWRQTTTNTQKMANRVQNWYDVLKQNNH